MSNDVIDFFSRDSYQTRPSLPTPPKPKQSYQAIEISKDIQSYVKVVIAVGSVKLIPYHCIYNILYAQAYKCLEVSFHMPKQYHIDMWWGKNLDQLIEPLQDRKLRSVHQFNPQKHVMPKDQTVPFIQEIRTANSKTYPIQLEAE